MALNSPRPFLMSSSVSGQESKGKLSGMSFRRYFMRGLYVLAVIAVAWHIHALGLFGARFEPDDASDRAVMLTALAHLSEQDFSRRGRNKQTDTIYLDHRTLDLGPDLYGVRLAIWPRNWQVTASSDARNASETTLDWTSSADLEVGDLQGLRRGKSRRDFNYRCHVRMSRPGYSQNGRTAIVKLQLGPSSHGIDLTYVLTFDGLRWNVLTYEVQFYA